MHNSSHADTGKVAVPLIGYYDGILQRARQAGSYGGRPSVGALDVASVEIIIGKDAASNRGTENYSILDSQLVNNFGDQFMDVPVTATRTVVRIFFSRPAFADKVFIKSFWF
jgi:hypothetical protein